MSSELVTQVRQVLAHSHIRALNFTFLGIRITSSYYSELAKAIAGGRVSIRSNPTLYQQFGIRGVYNERTNTLTFQFTRIVNAFAASVVVHECTHAVMDLRRLSGKSKDRKGRVVRSPMTKRASEAMAMISQWTFLVREGLSGELAQCETEVDELAAELAGLVHLRKALPPGLCVQLMNALSASSPVDLTTNCGWDGIP